jgi:hypothetical protein
LLKEATVERLLGGGTPRDSAYSSRNTHSSLKEATVERLLSRQALPDIAYSSRTTQYVEEFGRSKINLAGVVESNVRIPRGIHALPPLYRRSTAALPPPVWANNAYSSRTTRYLADRIPTIPTIPTIPSILPPAGIQPTQGVLSRHGTQKPSQKKSQTGKWTVEWYSWYISS